MSKSAPDRGARRVSPRTPPDAPRNLNLYAYDVEREGTLGDLLAAQITLTAVPALTLGLAVSHQRL